MKHHSLSVFRKSHRAWIFSILSVVMLIAAGVGAEGVTILIHGWQGGTGEWAWTGAMRNAIRDARLGGDENFGTITVSGSKGALTASCSPWNTGLSSSTSGEIFIVVDWTAVANHLISGVSSQEVAAAIAPKIYQGQSGQRPLSELPIHLIGHSRGGGMICELARLLGEQGIDVDQVTTLDPHPLTSSDPQPLFPLPSIIDTPISVYENVLFIDNDWQNILYPMGQTVSGAYNRLWSSLPGGYHNHTDTTYNSVADHLNIHLLYQGTIDLATSINDGQATLGSTERSSWFNTYETNGGTGGQKAGFYYSRINGLSNRLSTDAPVSGGDQIKAGYHTNTLLGGGGARSSLTWSAAVWPNVLTLDVLRGTTLLGPGPTTITVGESLNLRYNYRDYDSSTTATFYVDQDHNPYNDNNLATIGSQVHSSTGSTITQATAVWDTTGLSPGAAFYLYVKIVDATHTRYLYASPSFTKASNLDHWNLR